MKIYKKILKSNLMNIIKSDTKILKMMKIYLKCNINYLKDFKSLTPKKKPVNLPKTNKLILKISGIC
jgi:hypothetical protein